MMALPMRDIIQIDVASRLQPIAIRPSVKLQAIPQHATPVNGLVWNGRQQHHHRPWECHYKSHLLALQNTRTWSMAAMGTSCVSLGSIRRREQHVHEIRASASLIKSGFGLIKGWGQARRLFLYLLPKCVGLARDREGSLVVVRPGSTVIVLSIMSWIVLPNMLRRLYSYMETAPTQTTKRLVGRTPLEKVLEKVPYELSMCGALEDPARLLAAIVAFSHMAYTVAPTSVAAVYLTQIWSGATVVCVVWFLYRWKSNVFARIVTEKSFAGPDKERYLTMDHLSSLGLLILGCMAVAEACGMAVQSILTVGGIGGVATAFAAKDVMGNMLCGVALQFSRPFSIGDSITLIHESGPRAGRPVLCSSISDLYNDVPSPIPSTECLAAGPVTGQVVEMGIHSTLLLNADKFPIIVPNSFFSSQVIVNKSRVQWRGMAFTLPMRLQDLDRVPVITLEVRKMLTEHPKVFLETELPRCHITRVGGLSLELNVACNLKPMGPDEFLMTEEALLIEVAQIIVKAGALLGSDNSPCSFSGGGCSV
ncbi:hypothetical protein KC19_2G159000 [Ceratodon purpureus]|uniref:Mechanosensitive ion channel MscS domain-containing protein n=1 Tax=Ceratodon purpureus TaxID=3225 RepID=A0A8T0IXD9_CERPU|nr:hypothetical protein KC19_2G159000 [Ceratodon purpureus]